MNPLGNSLRRAALLAAALLAASLAGAAPSARSDSIWETFQQRRSVRKFRPDAVPDADLRKMIDAARLAPTSGNQQPWKFLIVRDPAKIQAMRDGCVARLVEQFRQRGGKPDGQAEFEKGVRSRLSGYFSAPAYIVVLTDNRSQYPDYNHWDGPLAAGYLMLAARALGYGTVFISDAIPESVTRQVLQIPDYYTRVCITPVGIPAEWPDSPPKKPLDDFIANEHL